MMRPTRRRRICLASSAILNGNIALHELPHAETASLRQQFPLILGELGPFLPD